MDHHHFSHLASFPDVHNPEPQSSAPCPPDPLLGYSHKLSSCSLETAPPGPHKDGLLPLSPVDPARMFRNNVSVTGEVHRDPSFSSCHVLSASGNDTSESSGQGQRQNETTLLPAATSNELFKGRSAGMSVGPRDTETRDNLKGSHGCDDMVGGPETHTESAAQVETSHQQLEKRRGRQTDFPSHAQKHYRASIKIESTEALNVDTDDDPSVCSIEGDKVQLQKSGSDRSKKYPMAWKANNKKNHPHHLSTFQVDNKSAMKPSRWDEGRVIPFDNSEIRSTETSLIPVQGQTVQNKSSEHKNAHKPHKKKNKKKTATPDEKYQEPPQRESMFANRNACQVPSQRTPTLPTAQEQFYRPRMRWFVQEPDQGPRAPQEIMPQHPIQFPRGPHHASQPFQFQSLLHESRRSFSVMCTQLETFLHAHGRRYCQMKNDLDAAFSHVKSEKEAALKEKAEIEGMQRRASEGPLGIIESQMRKLKDVRGGLEDISTDLSVQLAELNQMQEQLEEQQRVIEVLTKLKPDHNFSRIDEDEFVDKTLQECEAKLSQIETELNQSRKETEQLERISSKRMEYLKEMNILDRDRSEDAREEMQDTRYAKRQRGPNE